MLFRSYGGRILNKKSSRPIHIPAGVWWDQMSHAERFKWHRDMKEKERVEKAGGVVPEGHTAGSDSSTPAQGNTPDAPALTASPTPRKSSGKRKRLRCIPLGIEGLLGRARGQMVEETDTDSSVCLSYDEAHSDVSTRIASPATSDGEDIPPWEAMDAELNEEYAVCASARNSLLGQILEDGIPRMPRIAGKRRDKHRPKILTPSELRHTIAPACVVRPVSRKEV